MIQLHYSFLTTGSFSVSSLSTLYFTPLPHTLSYNRGPPSSFSLRSLVTYHLPISYLHIPVLVAPYFSVTSDFFWTHLPPDTLLSLVPEHLSTLLYPDILVHHVKKIPRDLSVSLAYLFFFFFQALA